jgi:hypothetical protein
MGARLAVTAGYGLAALLVAATSPVARRHPVRATAAKAQYHAGSVRRGLDQWLDVRSEPPPSLGELLFEGLIGALAARPPGTDQRS